MEISIEAHKGVHRGRHEDFSSRVDSGIVGPSLDACAVRIARFEILTKRKADILYFLALSIESLLFHTKSQI